MSVWVALSAVAAAAAVVVGRPPAHWVLNTRGQVNRKRRRLGYGSLWFLAPAVMLTVLVAARSAAHVLIGVALSVAMATTIRIWILRRAQRMRRERQRWVARALETLADGMRAGLTPAAALGQIDEPAEDVFAPARAALTMGGDVADALVRSAGQPGAEALASAASAWQVAERCGAPLADVLDNVTDNTRREREIARQVEAGVSPARATAQLMAVLPIFGVLVGRGLGTDPIEVIATTTAGASCLLLGIILACTGLLWVERIAVGAETS